ncbi:MaoC/PaaZ C-terminal domain-containing protein [Kribbella solani]|uniref:Acyl dehydratase n=1 Tax=Kribbella solani TaxID=236067 RepID=A0A841DHF2_9ACTN|nr:MaoC/PaaZ C-terminal domain-containing protein [Kribbella solani]MBB5977331.1 acyl dehydratase [Kribbella solani]MDX2972664.1 MaoC/PaaZ C-terminal domain-containing protein [Kribbella solani]MDX3001659.1 MaoC/PaaZ C-terminal domain-containing protein [Kribbella solani]
MIDQIAERTFGPITRTDIVRYAGAGGDFNPIHHDEVFATAAGYPSVFAHGLLTAGVLSTFVADWLGLANLRRFSVRYVDQVWPGDSLVTRGEVVSDDGERITARLTVHVAGADPRLVLTGEAEGQR